MRRKWRAKFILTCPDQAATLPGMVRDTDRSAPATFAAVPEPASFYRGPAQEEALARLEWLVDQRQRCGLVVAGPGMGKSHLAVTAARSLGGLGAEVIMLSLAGLPEGEWLDLLLDRIQLDPASRGEPRPTVLLLEDLDRGPADAREAAARLATAAEPRFASVTIIATARPAGLGLVPEEVRGRAAVRIELPLWNEEDVAGYLRAGLERTGRPGDLFTPAAAATLLRFAVGVPQVVSHLAELSLAAAEAEGLSRIESAIVEEVWRELASPEPERPAPSSEPAVPGQPSRFRPVRRLSS